MRVKLFKSLLCAGLIVALQGSLAFGGSLSFERLLSDAVSEVEIRIDAVHVALNDEEDEVNWITIHNYGAQNINLSGYEIVGRDADWKFKERVLLRPDEYVRVCFEPDREADPEECPYVAHYSLQQFGEVIEVRDALNRVIEHIYIPEMPQGYLRVHVENKAVLVPQDSKGPVDEAVNAPSTLAFNEALVSNASAVKDPQGEYQNYVEIVNFGNEPVDLSGLILTSQLEHEWKLPAIHLNPQEHLVIWLSGQDYYDDLSGEYHAGFRVESYKTTLRLLDRDQSIIDQLTVSKADINQVHGLVPDGVGELLHDLEPTPGSVNRQKGQENVYGLF